MNVLTTEIKRTTICDYCTEPILIGDEGIQVSYGVYSSHSDYGFNNIVPVRDYHLLCYSKLKATHPILEISNTAEENPTRTLDCGCVVDNNQLLISCSLPEHRPY